MKLCVGRIGQLLNLSSLAVETGVDSKTISSWIGVLESSFILFRLRPYHKNYNKRIVKMSKLYFYDTGLCCALLGLENPNQITFHPFRGQLFENFIIVDILKNWLNSGKTSPLYFWRDSTGHEIDLVIERVEDIHPVEIKSGQTINSEYFKGIQYWNKLTSHSGGTVIYGGEMTQKRSSGIKVIPWHNAEEMIKF